MFFAIGMPGGPARLIVREDDREVAGVQAQAGEVAVPVDAPGAWSISADGLSAMRTPLDDEALWHRVRAERWTRLQASDGHMMADRPMDPDNRAAWEAYRQALRDITDFPTPAHVVWPTAPGSSNA